MVEHTVDVPILVSIECSFCSGSDSESESVSSKDSGGSASELERNLWSGEIGSAARAKFDGEFAVGLVVDLAPNGGVAGVVEETCTFQAGSNVRATFFDRSQFLGRLTILRTLV